MHEHITRMKVSVNDVVMVKEGEPLRNVSSNGNPSWPSKRALVFTQVIAQVTLISILRN